MDDVRPLLEPGWGRLAFRAVIVLLAVNALLIGAGAVVAAAANPAALVILPIVGGFALAAVRLWRVGLFTSRQGLVARGPVKTLVVGWDQIDRVEVDALRYGASARRTVVITTKAGGSHPLKLWNARSLVMLGSPGGVDGLASEVRRHARGMNQIGSG